MTEAEEAAELIKKVINDPIDGEFLHFLAQHPHTRFNSQALIQLQSQEKASRAGEALNRLVAGGLVKTRTLDGVDMYWLTQNEAVHDLVKNRITDSTLRNFAVMPSK